MFHSPNDVIPVPLERYSYTNVRNTILYAESFLHQNGLLNKKEQLR